MMRKMLLIASAIAIPLGAIGVAAINGSTVAGASGSTLLNITCKIGGSTVTFASPGLSNDGAISASSTSTTNTSAQTLTCGAAGNGTGPALSIVTNSTPCTAAGVPAAPCTAPPPQMYSYDTVSGFGGSSTTLWTSIPKFKFKIGSTSYTSKSKSSAGTVCGSELGFVIKGKLSAPAAHANEATKVTACLGTDTTTGTCSGTGLFANDLGFTGCTIVTASLDPTTSKIKIS